MRDNLVMQNVKSSISRDDLYHGVQIAKSEILDEEPLGQKNNGDYFSEAVILFSLMLKKIAG
jgi:hypothetical protein